MSGILLLWLKLEYRFIALCCKGDLRRQGYIRHIHILLRIRHSSKEKHGGKRLALKLTKLWNQSYIAFRSTV